MQQLLRTVLELGLGLSDRRLLDVDSGLKGRLLEAVEQITLLHIRTSHEELLLKEGSDARRNVDAVDRPDTAIELKALVIGRRSTVISPAAGGPEGTGCAIAQGATKMMTGERTTRSSKETYMAFTFFRISAGLRTRALVLSTLCPHHQSAVFVTQHSSLRLPEANCRECNRSIAGASESVRQKERGYWTLVEDAFDFG
jgi:hypothetical protein